MSNEELPDGGAPDKKRDPIVHLLNLVRRFHLEQGDPAKVVRNIFNHVRQEFPDSTLAVMRAIAAWDESGAGAYMFGKISFERGGVKPALKAISPFLEKPNPSDELLLLGVRIHHRLHDDDQALALLGRISPESNLTRAVSDIRSRIAAREIGVGGQ